MREGTSAVQRCLHSSHLRAKGQLAIMWQPQRHFPPFHCWQDSAQVLHNRLIQRLEEGPPLLPESQCRFRANWGMVDTSCCTSTPGEVSGAKQQVIHNTRRPNQGLWHGQQGWLVEDNEEIWVPKQVYHTSSGSFMMVWWPRSLMMVIHQMPSLWLTEQSKALCLLLCWQTPSKIMRMASPFRYISDGQLFNLLRLKAITKVKETVIRDFLFADDCALNASTDKKMQNETDRFSSACENFDLTISSQKPKSSTIPLQASLITSRASQWRGKSYRQWTFSPTWAAHSL